MRSRLAGKRALVTGAGRGIGAETAALFAREGAHVILAELDLEAGEAQAAAIVAAGGRAHAIQCDVANPQSVRAAHDTARETIGPIDVLVNNAGVNVFSDPLRMTDEEWRRCLSIDLEGALHWCRAVLPDMLDQGGGSIVNIASVHGLRIIRGCFPYPVAKHGLIGLTRAIGLEYAAQGVRVNAIAPGYIETQIVTDYWQTFPDPSAERARAEAIHPPGRIGRPLEIAMTALFLASDEAPFINAAVIPVDGGRSVLYHD